MKKLLFIVLSLCFSGLAQSQICDNRGNCIGLNIQTQNWSIITGGSWGYPYGYSYIPPPIMMPVIPYVRQLVQVPVSVCRENYITDPFGNFIRDQFGNLLINRFCHYELRTIWQ